MSQKSHFQAYQVQASLMQGVITIPPSKSHTLRAILFASLARGESVIHHYLHSPDTQAMIQACSMVGAKIKKEEKKITVMGVAGKPCCPSDVIDAGNSGQVLRFITGISALIPGYSVITGDFSVRNRRPMQALLDALKQLNVMAVSTQENAYAPVIVRGPLQGGGSVTLQGEISQPVSGLLMACAFAPNSTEIVVKNPGETSWIDLTLDWFKRLGIEYQCDGYKKYFIPGKSVVLGFEYTVPGDWSSAAFPIVAALITQSEMTLKNLDINDKQGDKEFVFELQKRGAIFEIDEVKKELHIKKSDKLQGGEINVNRFIDAVPILSVLACFTESETRITGAGTARKKESDRLTSITKELKKMGAIIFEKEEELIISPRFLKGACVESHDDHRIAMALAVAGLAAQGKTKIENIDCVNKSFPEFVEAFQKLGAKINYL